MATTMLDTTAGTVNPFADCTWSITYSRLDHDYALRFNGEYVGSYGSYFEAEGVARALAFEAARLGGSIWSGSPAGAAS